MPKSTDNMSKSTEDNKVDAIALPVIKSRGVFDGFITFIREQGVVGLSIGLILGIAAKSVVDSIVKNILDPILGMMGNNAGGLNAQYICLSKTDDVCTNKLSYGAFLSDLLSFIIILAIVYIIFRAFRLEKLDKKKPSKE